MNSQKTGNGASTHNSSAANCYAKIKKFGDNNYSLDSEEIIRTFLLSRGGIYIDDIKELNTDRVFQDLKKAGFRFKTKRMNRIWVYPDTDHIGDANKMIN